MCWAYLPSHGGISFLMAAYLPLLHFICFYPPGMPQGVPPATGASPMMPQGGGPPGAPPSYGDAPPQQRPQVYDDGSPPPSPPHHSMPHPLHIIPAQVKHIIARF